VWDSLGEAYAAAGDREQAIASFAKAVELEPRNRHAAEQLEGLRSGD
jgi:cytochrome c-type biogenesis protein CcmH/NrfG